jgi:import inner membrane translocase subunit TIM16
LDEAALILNVPNQPQPSKESIVEKYEQLFKMNDPEKGGSFYLQSKIFRAKERFEMEYDLILKNQANPTSSSSEATQNPKP